MGKLNSYLSDLFGVQKEEFFEALKMSPSAQGYIIGAISELLLKRSLEKQGFEVIRIVEKPSGGNKAKNKEARGDFYIRQKGVSKDEWLVLESKGLKSNSEFRGGKLDSSNKVYNFLKRRVFDIDKDSVFEKGHKSYLRTKEGWLKNNSGKNFPKFNWDKDNPGPETYNLSNIWSDPDKLKKWVDGLHPDKFSEKYFRNLKGAISILETHQPSTRTDETTGITHAAPLIADFNIMSVDLFLRTGKHEFVFMNAADISHSPTSPNHLYQNYIIDILIPGLKDQLIIQHPWYSNIEDCIKQTKPTSRKIDKTQIDKR